MRCALASQAPIRLIDHPCPRTAQRAELLDRFMPIGRFADYIHVRLMTYQRHDPSAEQVVIVDRQDPNHAFVRVFLANNRKRRPGDFP